MQELPFKVLVGLSRALGLTAAPFMCQSHVQVMAETIRVARPHELARMRMDDNLTFFEDAMGSCERILRCAPGRTWGGALHSIPHSSCNSGSLPPSVC